ncbi:MAG: MBL fold metallo-hydrolase [Bryobacteraceae bacterium]|jgi:glyoxylase-like metal-dependent hydrolase (beta-lactamase superfamily II)
MFNRTLPACGTCAIVLLLTAGAVAASAQYTRANEPPGKSNLTAELVKTGLYLISGGGCNSLLRLSGNGLIVVDGKLAGNYEAFLAKVNKISDQPVRVLINTDYHENHTGNNTKFLEAGTQILAQENVRQNLTTDVPPGGKVAPPTKTYDHEITLRLGGIEAQLMHFGNAHTSGDSVVYFPNLKVVAVGDLFATTPDPDFLAGGSLVGWGPVLAQILKLDFDVVVPGTGPVVTRADLEAFKSKIDSLISRATALVKEGVPEDRLMGQLKTDDLGWRLNITGDRLDHFYAELSAAR